MFSAFSCDTDRLNNNKHLREIVTVFDVGQLNDAHRAGAICKIRKLMQNPELKTSALLLRNRKDGEYVVTPSREVYQQYGRGKKSYTEEDWELIQNVEGYARSVRHDSDWAAYIIPSDAAIGERFFIRDLIEDLVASNFWYTVSAASSAEAVWDGVDLVIDHDSYRYELVG